MTAAAKKVIFAKSHGDVVVSLGMFGKLREQYFKLSAVSIFRQGWRAGHHFAIGNEHYRLSGHAAVFLRGNPGNFLAHGQHAEQNVFGIVNGKRNDVVEPSLNGDSIREIDGRFTFRMQPALDCFPIELVSQVPWIP